MEFLVRRLCRRRAAAPFIFWSFFCVYWFSFQAFWLRCTKVRDELSEFCRWRGGDLGFTQRDVLPCLGSLTVQETFGGQRDGGFYWKMAAFFWLWTACSRLSRVLLCAKGKSVEVFYFVLIWFIYVFPINEVGAVHLRPFVAFALGSFLGVCPFPGSCASQEPTALSSTARSTQNSGASAYVTGEVPCRTISAFTINYGRVVFSV